MRPNRRADGDRGGGGIAHPQERERPAKPVEDRAGHPAEDAAVEDISSLPGPEQVAGLMERFRVLEEEEQPVDTPPRNSQVASS